MIEIAQGYDKLPQELRDAIKTANVFFSKHYDSYVKACGGELWYAYNDKLVLPINVYKKMGIKYVMYASEYYSMVEKVETIDKKSFLDSVQEYLRRKEKIAWISTSAAAFFDIYPDKSKRIPFGSHVVDLSLDLEELWKNVHSKHRNSIRKAEKSEVYVKSGGMELLNDYLKLDEETWERSNKSSYGKSFFEKIIENLKENAIIFIAYKDKEPQAGACYFLNDNMCYYMYGASLSHLESGATNYLHWEVIKYLKDRGIKKYSFVGCRINEDEDSKYHGIQRFKERFGGELIQGYMFKTILIPWKYKFFHLAYKIKNKHELSDAVDQEMYKWQDIN